MINHNHLPRSLLMDKECEEKLIHMYCIADAPITIYQQGMPLKYFEVDFQLNYKLLAIFYSYSQNKLNVVGIAGPFN